MSEPEPTIDPIGPAPDPKTTFESKTILTVLVGIVTLAGVFGYKYKGTDNDLLQIANALAVILPFVFLAGAGLFRRFGGGQIVNAQKKANIMAVKRARRSMIPRPGDPYPNPGIHHPPTTTPSRSPFPPGTPSILIFGVALLLISGSTGCMSRAEYVTFREGLNQVDQPILEEHKAWAEALANDPRKLPNLHDNETPEDRAAWLEAREAWHRERQEFMDNSRKNDAK